jgi:chemotaxis protein CheD
VCSGDEMIVTVLGSCISACLRDKIFGIGGMNHFMLPEDKNVIQNVKSLVNRYEIASTRYGSIAMEMLVNDILKRGGKRENLEAKIFGGGRITAQMSSDIGNINILFVTEYLKIENIPVVSQDVGDVLPRKVYFIPATGDVFVKKIDRINNNTIVEREAGYSKKIKENKVSSEITFFD